MFCSRLRERARSYKPNVETQPNELLCAVLRHDRDVETAKAIDFVWFKVKTVSIPTSSIELQLNLELWSDNYPPESKKTIRKEDILHG